MMSLDIDRNTAVHDLMVEIRLKIEDMTRDGNTPEDRDYKRLFGLVEGLETTWDQALRAR